MSRPLSWLLAAALLTMLAPARAEAQFGAAETVGPNGSAFGPAPEIGFDNTGGVVAMYEGGGIRAALKPNLGAWSATLLDPGSRASLAVARNGAAVIAWRRDVTTVQVAYRPSPGVAFTASQATFTGTAIGNVAAGIDSNGNAVVAWKDGGIRYATSTGPAFGGAQDAPLGASPGFDGRGGDTQRDGGPRAFRDDEGNIVLVYRDGNTAVVAHRGVGGNWSSAPLPGSATDVKADADPISGKLIVGYTGDGGFQAFTGRTAAPGMSGVVSDPTAPAAANSGVAVREADREDVAVWVSGGGVLKAAGCADAYQVLQAGAAPSGGGYTSAAAALTSGSDQLAGVTGPIAGGFSSAASSRPAGGSWGSLNGLSSINSGAVGAGAGYFGEALMAVVNTDGTVRGFTYTGTPSNTGGRCGGVQEPIPGATATPGPSATATVAPGDASSATSVICTYRYASEDDLCTATVGASVARMPTGAVTFSATRGGAFPRGNRCNLSPTPGSANVASCSVLYLRPYEVPPARSFPNVTATYGGAAGIRPSVGSTQLLGCAANPPAGGKRIFTRIAGMIAAIGGPLTIQEKTKLQGPKATCFTSVPSLAVIAGIKAASPQQTRAGALVSVTAAEWQDWLRFQANIVDPVDRNWREIVKPRKVPMPRFAGPRKAGKAEKAMDAFLANEAASLSLQEAQLTSIYRAQTAVNAGNKTWPRRQMLAVARFTKQIAQLRARHGKLARGLAAALRQSGQDVKLTPRSVSAAQKRIEDGFPAAVTKAVRRIAGPAGLADLQETAERLDAATADTTMAALIERTAAQDAQVASILERMAQRIRKRPSRVPGV